MKADQYQPSLSRAFALVGSPGTGKTSIAVRFPGPLLLVDCDNNLSGAFDRLQRKKLLDFDVEIINTVDGKEVKPYDRWGRMAKILASACADPALRTIVLDSGTAISEFITDDIKRQTNVPPNLAASTPLRIQDWGTFLYYWKSLITNLRTSGKIIVCTFHDIMEKDDTDGTYKYFLNIPGQAKFALSGLFSDVWNTVVDSKGLGKDAVYTYNINLRPANRMDKRGIKTSFELPATLAAESPELTKLFESL